MSRPGHAEPTAATSHRASVPTRAPTRAPGRSTRPGATGLVAALAAAALLLAAPAPAAAGDETPTQWQIDARAEPLQHAPPPPEKPVICVVDFGVTPTPDLDIVSRHAIDGGTLDDVSATPGTYGHGTTVAHMAAGKVNGWGGSGVFPHARIASVRIFPRAGERVPWPAYVRGLQVCWALTPRPVVAVLSVGGPSIGGEEALELKDVVEASRDRHNMSVVAAAGNGGGDADMPARLPAAFAVAGIAPTGELCAFSARGEDVDVVAPGCGLDQAGWDGAPWVLHGTSFAAPIAAGALAALRAYRGELSALEAESLLTAARGRSARLDVNAALLAAGLDTIVNAYRSRPGWTSGAVKSRTETASPQADALEAAPSQSSRPSRDRQSRRSRPGPKRLPTPRVRTHRSARKTVIRVLNRRRGLAVELRANGRRLAVARSRIVLRGRVAVARLRFVTELCASDWVKVTMRS